MKKLFYLIVAVIALTMSVSSCDDLKSDPCTYKVTVISKWDDIGIDGAGENRRSVTKYHMRYEYCVVADSTHDATGLRTITTEVDGDAYHTYDVGKTYIVKEGSWAYWRFKLWK